MEAAACAKELTAALKKRMLLHKEEAAECIQMLRKLGEPVEALQARVLAMYAGGTGLHVTYREAAPYMHGGLASDLANWLIMAHYAGRNLSDTHVMAHAGGVPVVHEDAHGPNLDDAGLV